MLDHKLDSIIRTVGEYTAKYRGLGLPNFTISEDVYDLFPSTLQDIATVPDYVWPAHYPSDEEPGVYLIFAATYELLYVGKASMGSCLGKRLYTYFHYSAGQACTLKHTTWTQQPRYLLTIGVPRDTPFEAAALEEFLIRRLHPSHNSVGLRTLE